MRTFVDREDTYPGRDGISSKNTLAALAIRGTSLLATVLVPVAATRVLQPEEVGTALVWLSVAAVLAVAAPLGIPWSVSVAVADIRSRRSDESQLKRLLTIAGGYLPVLLAALIALIVGLSSVWSEIPTHLAVVTCVIGISRAGSRIFSEVGKGFGNVSSAAITSDLLGPLSGLTMVGFAALIGLSFSAALLLVYLSLGWALSFAIAAIISPVKPVIRRDLSEGLRVDGIAVLATVAVLNVGIQQLHIVFAGLFLDELDAAHFSTAARLASLTGAPLMIVAGLASPDVALSLRSGRNAMLKVEQRLRKLTGGFLVASAALGLLYLLFGAVILRTVFGAGYGAGHWALVVLSLGPLASLYAGVAGLTLTLAEQRRVLLGRTAVGSTFAVLAMSLGGWMGGSVGLAAGYSAGQIGINLLLLSACRTLVGLNTSARPSAILEVSEFLSLNRRVREQ